VLSLEEALNNQLKEQLIPSLTLNRFSRAHYIAAALPNLITNSNVYLANKLVLLGYFNEQ